MADSSSDSDSESAYDSSSESESDSDSPPRRTKLSKPSYRRPSEPSENDKAAKSVMQRFERAFESKRYRRALKREEKRLVHQDDLFDFPYDREDWREEDLRELWADAPFDMEKPGWDPLWADSDDWNAVATSDDCYPPIAPFYLPYRKYNPVIPTNHFDISNAKAVVEELDRIEEFLKWVSYIFADGSSYEGTVWNDLANGKGVYVAEQGLVRYEGEWFQNNMEGHGVVELDIPDIEPFPDSNLETRMHAEGKILKRDFMSPEDKEWLEMDIKDTYRFSRGKRQIPYYERKEWIRFQGEKPEKGRYRYAGQWKHSRMHGCGVYEVNERPIFGRFYFGERVEDSDGCTEEICTLHAGIAEVAAAKARMFINKPDGMVREERGPYSDPQHPYFYEEEDVWQAPGFINQFYEVPDYWKTYVNEVDIEREMWLNSFYRAPLRLPMPAELEHWWDKRDSAQKEEFVLLSKEPEPDPEDPSKLIYTEDPVIMHLPSGKIINYIEDEEHGVRLFWQPDMEEGEDVDRLDPTKVSFLPLGFDEFYGQVPVKKDNIWKRLITSIENSSKPLFEKLEKWTEEQKKTSELRKKLIEQEIELVEAELGLEEALEDMEEVLKQQEKEAEENVDMDLKEEDVSVSPLPVEQEEKISSNKLINDEDEAKEEEEEEEEDDLAPSSFGSVADPKDKKNGPGRSPFSTLSFASTGLLSTVPSMFEESFSSWKKDKTPMKVRRASRSSTSNCIEYSHLVTFRQAFPENISLRMKASADQRFRVKGGRKVFATSQTSSSQVAYSNDHLNGRRSWELHWLSVPPERNSDRILSLHIPLQCLDS